MDVIKTPEGILLRNPACFNAGLSCTCGQAFRWTVNGQGILHGVTGMTAVDIKETDEGCLFIGTDEDTFNRVWSPYFDLDRSYEEICRTISEDRYLSEAVSRYYGIRILRQEPWEALCSFIISQNNNIPRISGIVSRLCEAFGERLESGDCTFPSYHVLAGLSVDDLAPLRAGFRSRYILDAAGRLESGELSLEEISKLPIEQARQQLMKIVGVGAKVAECTLLYGMGRMDAFPIDVWVKRIMAELYPDGLPACTRGVEGIAQQYLFHWRRSLDSQEKSAVNA